MDSVDTAEHRAPTVVTPLLIFGQHHCHSQTDPRGAAGDQNHFLPGTRHVPVCLCQLTGDSGGFQGA